MSPCEHIRLPDGTVFIVKIGKRRMPKCQFCRSPSSRECDYVIGWTLAGEEILCNAKMCAACARQVGEDKDFCPRHTR